MEVILPSRFRDLVVLYTAEETNCQSHTFLGSAGSPCERHFRARALEKGSEMLKWLFVASVHKYEWEEEKEKVRLPRTTRDPLLHNFYSREFLVGKSKAPTLAKIVISWPMDGKGEMKKWMGFFEARNSGNPAYAQNSREAERIPDVNEDFLEGWFCCLFPTNVIWLLWLLDNL